ncbi:MAG: anthranilate phosphoribosyltransferase [Candidatus Omnitrophica bacterium]|nr:anthranilate phosphoribosyltransferase [Candidatus Omnitrophota bacterium]
MIEEAINKLRENVDLESDLMVQAMEEIMTGSAQPDEIEAFLRGLCSKGETIDEIAAAAKVMRRHATKIKSKEQIILDTCGTGGDGTGTFNISTIGALVAAGAGVVVAKHGNKSVSSKCGSADLLTALGVKIDLEPEKVEACLERIGFGFLYAPLLHKAMKYAMPVRRKMGIRTIFNVLGPLTNPAGANFQLLGVYDKNLTQALAKALKSLGSEHVLVVHGEDGLDEVTTTAQTQISELKDGQIKTYKVDPAEFGLKKAHLEDLKGADAASNVKITLDILKGKVGPQRDIVLLNAGCAIYAVDKTPPLKGIGGSIPLDKVSSIKEGMLKAAESIDSGKALEKLEQLKEFTNK